MSKDRNNTFILAFTGVMASAIFVVTYFRFPFLGSQLHFANALCLLAGMLFGGPLGALAAGLGSALFDLVGYYGPVEAVITFVNKGAMALVCGIIVNDHRNTLNRRTMSIIGSFAGAILYVALYIFKNWVNQKFILMSAPETIQAVLISKAIPSLMNAAFAVIVAPFLYALLHPAMQRAGLYRHLDLSRQ